MFTTRTCTIARKLAAKDQCERVKHRAGFLSIDLA
jgi:hypothetical protein